MLGRTCGRHRGDGPDFPLWRTCCLAVRTGISRQPPSIGSFRVYISHGKPPNLKSHPSLSGLHLWLTEVGIHRHSHLGPAWNTLMGNTYSRAPLQVVWGFVELALHRWPWKAVARKNTPNGQSFRHCIWSPLCMKRSLSKVKIYMNTWAVANSLANWSAIWKEKDWKTGAGVWIEAFG